MLLASEDAQATREEVETVNEEFQATNEELETLNEELTASVEELRVANEDLATRTDELSAQAAVLEQREAGRPGGARSTAIDPGQPRRRGRRSRPRRPDRDDQRRLRSVLRRRRSRDRARGCRPVSRSSPADRPQQRAARGERFRMEFAVTQPDGTRRWFEAVAEPLTAGDRTWGGVLTIRDLSERTMRLSLERLMAAAGHELKTPVAALHGYLQLVERYLGPDSSRAGSHLRGLAASLQTRQHRRARRAALRREPYPGRPVRARIAPVDLVAIVSRRGRGRRGRCRRRRRSGSRRRRRTDPGPGGSRSPGAGLRQPPLQRRRARGDFADNRRDACVDPDRSPSSRSAIRARESRQQRAAAAVPAVHAAGPEGVVGAGPRALPGARDRDRARRNDRGRSRPSARERRSSFGSRSSEARSPPEARPAAEPGDVIRLAHRRGSPGHRRGAHGAPARRVGRDGRRDGPRQRRGRPADRVPVARRRPVRHPPGRDGGRTGGPRSPHAGPGVHHAERLLLPELLRRRGRARSEGLPLEDGDHRADPQGRADGRRRRHGLSRRRPPSRREPRCDRRRRARLRSWPSSPKAWATPRSPNACRSGSRRSRASCGGCSIATTSPAGPRSCAWPSDRAGSRGIARDSGPCLAPRCPALARGRSDRSP